MPCLQDWPLTSPCGTYGQCVTLPGGLPSDEASYCECDSYWVGAADFVALEGRSCTTNTVAVRCLWSLALLVALYTSVLSWSVVINACRRFRNTTTVTETVVSHGSGRGAGHLHEQTANFSLCTLDGMYSSPIGTLRLSLTRDVAQVL
jgi:hypothetical protein